MDDITIEEIKAFARNTQIPADKRIGALIENACNPGYGKEVREASADAIEERLFLEMDATNLTGFLPFAMINGNAEEEGMLSSLWDKSGMPGYKSVALLRKICEFQEVIDAAWEVYDDLEAGNVQRALERMPPPDKRNKGQSKICVIISSLKLMGKNSSEILTEVETREYAAERKQKEQGKLLTAELTGDNWGAEDFAAMEKAASNPGTSEATKLNIKAAIRMVMDRATNLRGKFPKPKTQKMDGAKNAGPQKMKR
ncbi:hypothetical protein JW721_03710 [Candidatus Micrarchaeota archaeon]|nr:hypothetical protein [Candidatus Micrarchaeota archaeon]